MHLRVLQKLKFSREGAYALLMWCTGVQVKGTYTLNYQDSCELRIIPMLAVTSKVLASVNFHLPYLMIVKFLHM